MENLLFYIALSFILVHEMDAVHCKEWRIFPGLKLLDDKLGYIIFTVAHIPLYIFIFWAISYPANSKIVITGLEAFFIVHVFLHILLLRNKKNMFKGWLSWTLIIGAGLFALLDIL